MHCRERRPAPNLTDCPRHGDHLDPPCAGAGAPTRMRVRGRARRVDVVHDAADAQRGQPHRYDARADVAAASRRARARAAEAASACARGDRRRGCPPPGRERPREGPRGGTSPRFHARLGLPERTSVHFRLRDDLADERSYLLGEPPSVPAPSTPARAFVLARRRRPSARANSSRRPEHSAHRTTGHGPGEPRGPQTGGLNRTSASRQSAQSPARATTDGAALRQE